jgi:hypothetical protein
MGRKPKKGCMLKLARNCHNLKHANHQNKNERRKGKMGR